MSEPISEQIARINDELKSAVPGSVAAVALETERDLLFMKMDVHDFFRNTESNGPTGHGDVCWSDADPGL